MCGWVCVGGGWRVGGQSRAAGCAASVTTQYAATAERGTRSQRFNHARSGAACGCSRYRPQGPWARPRASLLPSSRCPLAEPSPPAAHLEGKLGACPLDALLHVNSVAQRDDVCREGGANGSGTAKGGGSSATVACLGLRNQAGHNAAPGLGPARTRSAGHATAGRQAAPHVSAAGRQAGGQGGQGAAAHPGCMPPCAR